MIPTLCFICVNQKFDRNAIEEVIEFSNSVKLCSKDVEEIWNFWMLLDFLGMKFGR